MNNIYLILLTLLVSCVAPSFNEYEILVDKVNISFRTDGIDSTKDRYFKIIINDSRKYFKDSNMPLIKYAYVKYRLIPNLKIPKGYKKIIKYDILKLDLKCVKDEENKRVFLPDYSRFSQDFQDSQDENIISIPVILVFESDLVINGYLPDSCFVYR